jgi:predicted acylesterase/phospholipase RssA
MKRAITLAGGGPAAGLHIGVLKALEESEIKFDVWALSCIGAWVGIVYNKFDRDNANQTERFFRDNIFRSDDSYSRFPINSVFGTDWNMLLKAWTRFAFDITTYDKLWLPKEITDLASRIMTHSCNIGTLDDGDRNKLLLEMLATNPFARYFVSMMWLTDVTGLARINYPTSSFARSLEIEKLTGRNKPFIYHNAWNLSQKKLQLFANFHRRYPGYRELTPESLCACSALPFVEETVVIEGDTFCEGALVDTVNFKDLLDDHCPLDEIWICRIVDTEQVRAPRNLHDALGNLCMLFAAAVGDDDVKLFKWHAKERGWRGRIVEIKVSADVNFEWTHMNLTRGIQNGYEAAREALENYYLGEDLVRLLRPEAKRQTSYAQELAVKRRFHALLDRARQEAFADLVRNWVLSGANGISVEHLHGALGPEMLDAIACKLRTAPRDFLPELLEELRKACLNCARP